MDKEYMMKETIKKVFYLFFPIVIGSIVAFIIRDSIDYTSLVKPILAPTKVIFPIMWSIIYLLMGLSYYLYKKDYDDICLVDIIYYIQLFVNALWALIFFLWKARLVAIIWIIILDLLVILLIYLFCGKKKISAYLNIPYLVWILFATYLTIGIYILN